SLAVGKERRRRCGAAEAWKARGDAAATTRPPAGRTGAPRPLPSEQDGRRTPRRADARSKHGFASPSRDHAWQRPCSEPSLMDAARIPYVRVQDRLVRQSAAAGFWRNVSLTLRLLR